QIRTVPRTGVSYEPLNFDDLIHPLCRWAWDEIESRNKLHKFAWHVRSSQAFAINLFGGLPESGVRAIMSSFFGSVGAVERPILEWEDEKDRLRETVMKGQQTQVDVLLRGTRSTGDPVALLVEVKLTESDFGSCSGAGDKNNDTSHLCSTPGPFGTDPLNCFKLRNGGGKERRTYDRYIPISSLASSTTFDGCWYRTSAYQPMRNVATAAMLQKEEGIETAVAVCAPLLHREMWSHFQKACSVLPQGSFWPLPAELVLALHDDATYQFLRDRYFLDVSGCPELDDDLELATWGIVEAFDRWFDHRFSVVETHPGGGQYECISLVDHSREYPRSVVDLNRTGRVHIHAAGETRSLDDAWERAMNGQADSVAADIGLALGLQTRQTPSKPASRAYRRTVELGRMAGESLRWKIDGPGTKEHLGDTLMLVAHRLERHGPQYSEARLPSTVFASRQQF
ncbi:MAG: PGN_0703 family putative restriction endonuclease, partial [Actinomycetota bacterium]